VEPSYALLKLPRPHLELDRDHGRGRDEHGIHPPAEPRDVELEVDPGGSRGGQGFPKRLQGRAKHGQLQPPGRKLLGGERVAMRARERRVNLLVGGAQKRGDRVGVEGGVETRAGPGWAGPAVAADMAGRLPNRGTTFARNALTEYGTCVHYRQLLAARPP